MSKAATPEHSISLLPNRFNEASFMRSQFAAKAPIGTPMKSVEDPAFWMHVCAPMNQFDRIEVVEESGAWWADVIVVSTIKKDQTTTQARCVILHSKQLGKTPEKAASETVDNYKPRFSQGFKKWGVERLHDNKLMVEGLDTKDQAEEWIAANIAEKKAA